MVQSCYKPGGHGNIDHVEVNTIIARMVVMETLVHTDAFQNRPFSCEYSVNNDAKQILAWLPWLNRQF